MNLLQAIESAGVIGCGGAGFPTHVKLKGQFEYLIVNGAECEPLLRPDRYLMTNKASDLVRTVSTMAAELQIPHAVIALKGHYYEECASLRQAIAAQNAPVTLHELESFYPAGDEQTIVYEVTGRVVPPAGLPAMVGAVVDNVATIYAIGQALLGHPFVWKYLTVTGEVNHPVVLKVPVGTSFKECLELAGGTRSDRFFVVSGGPMMGRPVTMADLENAVVTKTTSGILVLPPDGYHASHNKVPIDVMLRRARSACIQCTQCTQLCPRHLLGHELKPHMIMRKMARCQDIDSLMDDPEIRNAQLCCECGICETYACPMSLQPRTINSMLKKELGARKIRYERREDSWTPSSEREVRKAPSERVAARVGVLDYYHYDIKELVKSEPSEVQIPLRMHIGAPSEPVVSVGQSVRRGDLIARIPEGALGENIHASIDGTVTAVGDRIVIRR